MTRALLIVLLLLSLFFNAFFAAGYARARAMARNGNEVGVTGARGPGVGGAGTSAEVINASIARTLALDPDQRAVFANLRSSVEEDASLYDNAIALARQDLAEELKGDAPDLDRVQSITANVAELDRQRRLVSAARFSQFVATLSPQQRRLLADALLAPPRRERRGEPGGETRGEFGGSRGGEFGGERGEHPRGGAGSGPGDPSRRRPGDWRVFDRDGDGRLSPEERAAADQQLAARREEMDRRHHDALKRFDLDGDGNLSPDERAAMTRWIIEHPPQRGPRPEGGGDHAGRNPQPLQPPPPPRE